MDLVNKASMDFRFAFHNPKSTGVPQKEVNAPSSSLADWFEAKIQ